MLRSPPAILAVLSCCLVLGLAPAVPAKGELDSLRHLRDIEADDGGPEGAPGVPFPPMSGLRLLPDTPRPGAATVLVPDGSGDPANMIPFEVPDPINLAFADGELGTTHRVLLLDHAAGELIDVRLRRRTGPRIRRRSLGGVGLLEPAGMAFDPTTRELYVLDAARGTLVRLSGRRFSRAADVPLPPELAALTDLRGLAFEPGSRSFYLVSPAAGEIYEVDLQGSFRALRQLPELGAFQPLAMSFAASWDTTDEPERTHLYLATSNLDTGSILVTEWTFTPPVTNQPRVKQPSTRQLSSAASQIFAVEASSAAEDSSLLQTIEAWRFDPPSPDSAGIAYQPSRGTMLMSDSEVNEMGIYEGVNVFEHDRFGTLLDTFDTTDFSNEPTGVAVDPASGHCFFSDDTGDRSVYVVDPGSDGLCVTSDDSVTRIDTEVFGCNDPEGVTFCQGSLFVSDGVNDEFYEVRPGSNGTFGDGDDVVTSCDTFSLGVENPEGITCDESTGQIFLVGKPDDLVVVAQQNCQIVATIDISDANANKPAGLGLGPSSVNPGQRSLWLTARGVDNGKDPRENDGLIYEMSMPPGLGGGNSAPVVQAGPGQTIILGEVASLQGSVVDDGIPGPFTSQWSKVSGPGTVSFAAASQPATTATFSAAGDYRLRLTADDGELVSSDDVNVMVATSGGSMVLDKRITNGNDDVEEEAGSGVVSSTSSDLEIVEANGPQTVGVRFRQLGLPQGVSILDAWIQFTADETDSGATVLTIEAQAANHASPFLASNFNVSSRPRTAASVTWQPPSWDVVGQANFRQRTPNLSSIVQEIVGRSGWASGNAIAFIITGSGKRVAESVEGDGSAALLHVVYQVDDNSPPSVSITSPPNGSSAVEGSPVSFSGTASDPEDGNLSSGLAWSSNRDGAIGSGDGFTTSALSLGTHTITATVTDSQGSPGSDQITLTITSPVNLPPTVSITAPPNGSSAVEGSPVGFSGTASDPEDGNLSSGLAWSSNRDGAIGSGAGFTTSALSLGTHTITATVTDSQGSPGSDQVTLTITSPANLPPTVSITAPPDGSIFGVGSPVSFSGTASDPEDGNLSSALAWSSNRDGAIGSGAGFTTSALTEGTHTITASVNDSGGLAGSDQITVTVSDGGAIVFETRVATSSDDAEERVDGTMKLSNGDLEMVFDKGGDQTVGLRFQGVAVPSGATVTNAYVQFEADEAHSIATSLTIRGQAADDAPVFVSTDGYLSSRPTTGAAVAWSPPAWNAPQAAGPDQRTPNLAPVIQQIVGRQGWAAGNALVLLVTGTGERVAESFDSTPAGAPLLHVQYTTDGNLFPTVDAGPDQNLLLPATVAQLAGSVSDDGLPDPPAAVTASWSQVGGPAGVVFANAGNPTTSATFPGAGNYVLRLTGDDSQLSASDDVTITVIDPAQPLAFEARVVASTDDAEERADTDVKLSSSDLEMVFDKGGNQLVGMRFQGVTIPQGASITGAFVQFEVDEIHDVATSLTIRGQAADDAPTFAASLANISPRPITAAAVAWSPPAWPVKQVAGPDQRTPDLAPLIQEIVNRPGWTAGHAIVLIVTGTGERAAESYDGTPAAAPLLHVEYQIE